MALGAVDQSITLAPRRLVSPSGSTPGSFALRLDACAASSRADITRDSPLTDFAVAVFLAGGLPKIAIDRAREDLPPQPARARFSAAKFQLSSLSITALTKSGRRFW